MLKIVFDIDGTVIYNDGFKDVSYIKFNDIVGLSNRDKMPLIKTTHGPVFLSIDNGLEIVNNIQSEELLQLRDKDEELDVALLMVIDKAIRLWNNNTRFGRKNVAEGW